jgi:hypothetical protein
MMVFGTWVNENKLDMPKPEVTVVEAPPQPKAEPEVLPEPKVVTPLPRVISDPRPVAIDDSPILMPNGPSGPSGPRRRERAHEVVARMLRQQDSAVLFQ